MGSFLLTQGWSKRWGGGLVEVNSWLSREQVIPRRMVTVKPTKG